MLLIYVNLINVCCLWVMLWRFISCHWKKIKVSSVNGQNNEHVFWININYSVSERKNLFFDIKRQAQHCSIVRHMHELTERERTHIVIINSKKKLNVYNSSLMLWFQLTEKNHAEHQHVCMKKKSFSPCKIQSNFEES